MQLQMGDAEVSSFLELSLLVQSFSWVQVTWRASRSSPLC